jgi:hypothetical protein
MRTMPTSGRFDAAHGMTTIMIENIIYYMRQLFTERLNAVLRPA